MKCTNNHDLVNGAKYCGECGSAAVPEMLKATCGGCSTEQSADHKHCTECGGTLVKAGQAELESALNELRQWHKANASLTDQLEVPAFDPKSIDFSKAGSAGSGKPGEGDEDDDDDEEVTTFLKALIAGHNHSREHLKIIGNAIQQGRKDQGLMVKALATGLQALAGQIAALKSDLDLWKGQRRPRQAALHTFAKSAAQPLDGDPPAGPKLSDVFPPEVSVEMVKSGLLGTSDPTQIQFWAEQGLSLAQLSERDPHLASRLATALQRIQTKSAAA